MSTDQRSLDDFFSPAGGVVGAPPGGPQGYRDPGVLRQLYWEEGLQGPQIADLYGIAHGTVYKWMDRHGVERRVRGEAKSHAADRERPHRDPEVLRRLYHDETMTLSEVSDELDCSVHTVVRQMNRHGIERRDPSFGVSRAVEACREKMLEQPYADRETLHELYVEREMGVGEIAEKFSVSTHTILDHLRRNGIDIDRNRGRRKYGDFVLSRPHDPYPAFRGDDGFVPEHQLVAIAAGADPHDVFSPDTEVHHLNGCKTDNRPSNLHVTSRSEHAYIHKRGRYTWADMELFARFLLDPTFRRECKSPE